ncbi:hypothetical protein A9P82_15005 [Arachidicoccus ginsenosidimutans]|uniref:TlpA family protein disulfide reductase n=1 Tax=Arachidicoccus sp. BS20 TaxID=1850526 RepID=UPI0007F075FD|nr:redoxin family protein [Arachidicoccus sp. BS20]ANI90480.1 hypothetical protein A9P82_15005 [Arachidicoccus sp. BS20]
MKQLLFATVLLLCISANAQSNLPLAIEDPKMDAYLQNRKSATLSIQINNLPDSIKKTKITYTLVCFGSDFQVTKYTHTNANGFAKIILNQNFPYQQIWLSVGDYLYTGAYVNKDLTVIIDADKIKDKDGVFLIGNGVTYSGTDGELNTVINKHTLYKREEQNNLNDRLRELCQSRRKLSVDTFQQKTDSILQALTKIDNAFILQYPKYDWAIQNEVASGFYGELCTSYWGDKMPENLFAEINKHKPYFTSNDGVLFYRYFHTYITSAPDNRAVVFHQNELMKNYAHYNAEQKAVLDSINYYNNLPQEEKSKHSSSTTILMQKEFNLFPQEIEAMNINKNIKIIDSLFPQPKSDVLKTFFLDDGKNEFALVYPEILNSTKTGWCKQLVANELNEATIKQKSIDSLLASAKQLKGSDNFIGKPLETLPFGAALYQLDSVKNVDDLILNLKSKFKDKALVIDFWATWCAPCLQELPFSKKLHEANKDLPVEYIYICTNTASNINVWKNKIAELQLPGTHIFMDEKIVSALKSSFNNAGSGFPTYVAIGVDGKLRTKAIQWMQSLDRAGLKNATGL